MTSITVITFLHRRVLTVQDGSVDLISRDANRIPIRVYKLLVKKLCYQRHASTGESMLAIVVGIDIDLLLIRY